MERLGLEDARLSDLPDLAALLHSKAVNEEALRAMNDAELSALGMDSLLRRDVRAAVADGGMLKRWLSDHDLDWARGLLDRAGIAQLHQLTALQEDDLSRIGVSTLGKRRKMSAAILR